MNQRVLTSGITSFLGNMIADKLEADGQRVTRTARSPLRPEGTDKLDLSDEAAVRAAAAGQDIAILCPILSVSAPAARWLAEEGVHRLVLFSSNNVAIDQSSPVYEALRQAERSLADVEATITILRPTMIYGYPGDGNLSRLFTFAKRLGFLPCPGSGGALQQPTFVDDVANAAVYAATTKGSEGTFAIAGPEILSTRDLFGAALRAAGRSNRLVLPLPLAPVRALTGFAQGTGIKLPISTTQLDRLERDKTAVGDLLPGFQSTVSIDEGLTKLAGRIADVPTN